MLYGAAPYNPTDDNENIWEKDSNFKFDLKQDQTILDTNSKIIIGVLKTLPSYTLMAKIGDEPQKNAAEMIEEIKNKTTIGFAFVALCMAKGLTI